MSPSPWQKVKRKWCSLFGTQCICLTTDRLTRGCLFSQPHQQKYLPCARQSTKRNQSIEILCLGNTFTVPSEKPKLASWQCSASVPGHCPFQNGNWQIGEEGRTPLCCKLCGAVELPLSFSLLNSTTNTLTDLVSAQAGVPRGCAAAYTFLVFLIELPIMYFSERTGGKQPANLVEENG